MVRSLSSLIVASFTSLTMATPFLEHRAASLGPFALLENITVPFGWSAAGSPAPSTVMTMQIALKQNNIDGLSSKLMDISNPSSPNYGKWLSPDEIAVYTSPSAETVSAVKLWLASWGYGDKDISQPTPDWMEVNAPISKAQLMLSTTYGLFHDSLSGLTVPRAKEYSIPLLLHNHIDTIQPTTAFHRNMGPQVAQSAAPRSVKRQGTTATCDPNNIVPSCIQSYYNVDYTSKGKASLGVTGFIGLSASHSDASTFINQYYTKASGSNFKDGSISGATNQASNPDLEGNLDTQYALSLGYPNSVTYYAVGPNNNPNSQFSDELVNFGNYLINATNPPTSVSASYGGEEQGFSSSYLTRICNEFMKAGSRGISIFFSSGDYGVGGNGETSCNQGFYALFPASCPYITSVGATQLVSGAEQAATFERGGSTGGGFSYYFSAPSYQTSDTKNYINKNLDSSYSGYYNPNGRGYPDVALVGEYYDIILNGASERVYGTSASSPSWAALISLINDYRISEGKSTLGFLNPLLYGSARSALNDITTGHNQGCGTYGYPAATGWDPTTGLGSLNFAKLRKALG